MPKTERGDPLEFLNIHSVVKHQKIEGKDPLRKKFSEKRSRSAKKIEREDPLVSPGMACYAGKRKTFLVQFARPNGAI